MGSLCRPPVLTLEVPETWKHQGLPWWMVAQTSTLTDKAFDMFELGEWGPYPWNECGTIEWEDLYVPYFQRSPQYFVRLEQNRLQGFPFHLSGEQ